MDLGSECGRRNRPDQRMAAPVSATSGGVERFAQRGGKVAPEIARESVAGVERDGIVRIDRSAIKPAKQAVIAAVIAAGLFIYLTYAMLYPERF